jgi:uncharacterized membrane protein YphA (DoxX/SURF4 family)
MNGMDHSMAHPGESAGSLDLPAWKTLISHISALLLAVLFVASGVWKILDPFTWRTMVEQLGVPYAFSMPLAIGLGIVETLGGVLVLVPRFRRWGAWICIALLIVFMLYMGVNYNALAGKDCSCFPWVKRTVSPGFFVGDAIMLLLAAAAWVWARQSDGVRSALVVLGAIAVFAAASFGVSAARLTGTKAPSSIAVDGKPYSLERGRVFLYFYDPQCSHCEMAAKKMSKMDWGETRVIAVPTASPQWAASFLHDTGLKAGTSLELQKLKQTFPFKQDPPYGVALENGRQIGDVPRYDETEPETTLRSLHMIK